MTDEIEKEKITVAPAAEETPCLGRRVPPRKTHHHVRGRRRRRRQRYGTQFNTIVGQPTHSPSSSSSSLQQQQPRQATTTTQSMLCRPAIADSRCPPQPSGCVCCWRSLLLLLLLSNCRQTHMNESRATCDGLGISTTLYRRTDG